MIELVRKELAHMSRFQKEMSVEYGKEKKLSVFEKNRCDYIAEGLDMAIAIIDKYIAAQ